MESVCGWVGGIKLQFFDFIKSLTHDFVRLLRNIIHVHVVTI